MPNRSNIVARPFYNMLKRAVIGQSRQAGRQAINSNLLDIRNGSEGKFNFIAHANVAYLKREARPLLNTATQSI